MRKLVVFALVCTALVGAGQAFETISIDKENRLAAVTRILTGGGYPVATGVQTAPVPAALPVPSVISTQTARPLLATTSEARSSESSVPYGNDNTRTAVATPASGESTLREPEPPRALTPEKPTTSWPTVVVPEGATVVTPAVTTPTSGKARYELVLSLQTELTRVGCYGGRIDGSWRMSSKRAMRAFMERVNASLPVDFPDYILLTLLQAYPAGICGRDCPKGQVLGAEGQCLPKAIVARANKKLPQPMDKLSGSEPVVAWSTSVWPEQPRADLPGRMSVGGPLPPATAPNQVGTASQSGMAGSPFTTVRDGTASGAGFNVAALDRDPDAAAAVQTESLVTDNTDGQPLATKRAGAPTSKKNSAKLNRQAKRYAGNSRYRSVQNLFMHPLGRM